RSRPPAVRSFPTRRSSDLDGPRWQWFRPDRDRRSRRRHFAGCRRSAVRALLHDQAAGAGPRAVDLPLDRRRPRWPTLGRQQPGWRGYLHRRAAGARWRAELSAADPVVFVVDDDPSVLRALCRLFSAAGLEPRAFSSSTAFLEAHDPATPGCLVLDLALPGLHGLELQQALSDSGGARPIVFITGRGDIPTTVRAMKGGAVDFLTKPVNDSELLAAVQRAIDADRLARAAHIERDELLQRLASLTPREREVLVHVVAGRLNKQIAADLGTVEKTIKVHRARVMEKMAVRSLADLVRIAERLGLPPADGAANRTN